LSTKQRNPDGTFAFGHSLISVSGGGPAPLGLIYKLEVDGVMSTFHTFADIVHTLELTPVGRAHSLSNSGLNAATTMPNADTSVIVHDYGHVPAGVDPYGHVPQGEVDGYGRVPNTTSADAAASPTPQYATPSTPVMFSAPINNVLQNSAQLKSLPPVPATRRRAHATSVVAASSPAAVAGAAAAAGTATSPAPAVVAAAAPATPHFRFGIPLEQITLLDTESGGCVQFVAVICRHLQATALDVQGLFRHSGSVAEMSLLRDEFESERTASPMSASLLYKYDTHTLTGSLKAFFRELPQPLVPDDINNEAIELLRLAQSSGIVGNVADMIVVELRALVDALPPANYLVLRELVRLLRAVAANSERNMMTTDNLITCIAPSLRCLPAFVLYGITRYADMFGAGASSSSAAAASRQRPMPPTPSASPSARSSMRISRAFDVDATTQAADDDDDGGETDTLMEHATQQQAAASIAWSHRGEATSESGQFDFAAAKRDVRAFETASMERGAAETRHKAVRQLLQSEEAYVAKVCQYVHSFVVPLRKVAAQFQLSADDVHTLNANCDQIYKWHLQVLLELKKRVEVDRAFVIGDVLAAIAPSDVYQVYTQHYDSAVAVFEQQRRLPNEAFLQFVQQCRQREPSFSTDLCAYFLCPVQRLQAYKDLALAVRDATPRGHPERAACDAAVVGLDRLFDFVNLGAQQALRRRQVEELALAVPAAAQRAWAERRGYLHKQGALNKTWKSRYFVLKNHKLYYYKSEESVKPQGIIPIDDRTTLAKLPAARNGGMMAFTITHHQHRVYQLAAPDMRQVDEWLGALRHSIDAFAAGNGNARRRDALLRQRDAELQLEAFRATIAGATQREEQIAQANAAALRAIHEQTAQLRAALALAETQLVQQTNERFGAYRQRLKRQTLHAPQVEAALARQIASFGELASSSEHGDYATMCERIGTVMRETQPALTVDMGDGSAIDALQALAAPSAALLGVEAAKKAIASISIE
jgi:hypothetical protein